MREPRREQMKATQKQNVTPKKDWARLYVDKSEASLQAIKLLRNAGYLVITFPVNGKMGPELMLGRNVYRGLEKIKEAIEE